MRTYTDDNVARYNNNVPGIASWFQVSVLPYVDVDAILLDAENYWSGNYQLVAASGGTVSDMEIALETATATTELTNTSSSPMFVQAYWMIPRRDQPSTAAAPGTLRANTYSGSNTPVALVTDVDMNFSIWQARNLLLEWKIIKTKQFSVMPGCTANLVTSVGRRRINRRHWDALGGAGQVYFKKGVTKYLMCRVSGTLGIDTVTSPLVPTVTEVDYIYRTKWMYKYRPLIDTRPSFAMAASQLGGRANNDPVSVINPISGQKELAQEV